ncbi:MAG: 3-oxoacyl-[acyl-carrier-protein] reductase [Clostridiales bacterium]|nr:3-oxoacyl-[acyl-carrier-protein] reductase [Clostridiales bacterium]
MDLTSKTAIVTGGTRGIGKAIAVKFAKNGANIVLNALNEELLIKTCKEIEQFGVKCTYFKGDISDMKSSELLIEHARKNFINIDVLVNNAGITRDNLIVRMSEQEWDEVIKVNLKGTFNCTKMVLKLMLKQKKGSIINISSIVGNTGNVGQANYSASKAAIFGFTKSVAKEVARKNVRCNVISPGFIDTDMTKKLSDEIKEKYKKIIPLGRFGMPEEIADACYFLANAEYITGQVLAVDGGTDM